MKMTIEQFLSMSEAELKKSIPRAFRPAFPGKVLSYGPLQCPGIPAEFFNPPGFYIWSGMRYNFLTGELEHD